MGLQRVTLEYSGDPSRDRPNLTWQAVSHKNLLFISHFSRQNMAGQDLSFPVEAISDDSNFLKNDFVEVSHFHTNVLYRFLTSPSTGQLMLVVFQWKLMVVSHFHVNVLQKLINSPGRDRIMLVGFHTSVTLPGKYGTEVYKFTWKRSTHVSKCP